MASRPQTGSVCVIKASAPSFKAKGKTMEPYEAVNGRLRDLIRNVEIGNDSEGLAGLRDGAFADRLFDMAKAWISEWSVSDIAVEQREKILVALEWGFNRLAELIDIPYLPEPAEKFIDSRIWNGFLEPTLRELLQLDEG